ncbi:hypothetical protein AVEN_113113-1 [Araneus ventricosus]|uniref:Reverse transcriptase domain-containing protein n=1 Tax=Araneus ventricosus TaxID=182803 RepID=A0A4Y2P192_ARAVE|nr:hypothetical protein AVEN_113113-1 [Araneus ventricosus]
MECSEKGTSTEVGLKILQKLYPKIEPRTAQIQPHQTLLEEETFSQQEIDDILKNIPNGKNLQHPLQYGFREGKLADDALLHATSLLEQARRQEKHAVLISLDISGAFGSLQYSSIRDIFASLSLFSNISETLLDPLRNRKVAMQTSEGPILWEQTQGCLQGLCSGPAFWNIVAAEILSVQWPQGVHLQAFADDFAFIITDNTREGLRNFSKLALDKFKDWAGKNKLHVSMEKSSYVLFSKLVRGPTIKWGNQTISHKNHLKYLGVTIDHKLSCYHT